MDASKLKLGMSDVIKGAVFLCTIVGLYYKIEGDMALIKSDVSRNTAELVHTKQEFKEIHNEFKVMSKEMTQCKEEILNKIDQKHSR